MSQNLTSNVTVISKMCHTFFQQFGLTALRTSLTMKYILTRLKIVNWDVNHQLKLEDLTRDLKVLKHSPDLLNDVKIGQGQLQLIIKHILFYQRLGLWPFWSSDLKH